MSLSSENMMKLMAYADGELEGRERTEAELLLASDVDAVRFVEQLAGLGELVKVGHEASAAGKAVASFDVADAVMALAKDAKGQATVTSLEAARKAKEAKGAQNFKLGVGVVTVLALAASIVVFTQHRNEETPMAKGPPPGALVQPSPGASPASTVGDNGVDVSTVNSPGNSVSVFYLPTANELSTSVVVWVDETGEK
jgi:anti-sigma factor RsiW